MCHIRQMEPLDTNNMNIKKLICLLFLVSTAFAQSVYTGNPVMTNTGQDVYKRQANGSAIGGNVTGPGSATANDSAGFADGTGKVLQDTGVSEVGGVVKGSLLDKGGAQYNFKTLSPISDAVADATCSMDGSTANLTCADAPFSTCPVGAVVSVPNAATGGYSLTYGTVSYTHLLHFWSAGCQL